MTDPNQQQPQVGMPAYPPVQYPPAPMPQPMQPPRFGPQQFGPGPGQPPPGVPNGYHPPQPVVMTAPKSSGIAVLLSFLWFGAGHLYANQTTAGVLLLVYHVFLAILAVSVIGLVIAVPLWLISAPIVMITASQAANAYNQRNGLVVR